MTARLPVPGGDSGAWGTVLNGFLSVSLNSDGTIQPTAITQAGGLTTSSGVAMEAGATFTGYLAPAAATLSQSAGSVAVNARTANAFNLTLSANGWTIANPSNPIDGQVIRFRITQGSGGGFGVFWGTQYDFGTTGQPILSTTAGLVDVIAFEYIASISKWIYLGAALGN
ncbi:MAG TPA: hypothetical protein VGS28_02110 [Candidatus Saccharimonadales bacterium]|nr:hypothetical protein [Candidatus Saccharimonadales bacterium]